VKCPIEKPGTPEELVHHGIKGMHWGVRKESGTSSPSSASDKSASRKETAKKVAIGTGVLVAVAGTAFVAYKLNQSGKLPISSIAKSAAKSTPAVEKAIQEPTSVIHFARGKNKGLHFLKQGGTPDHFNVWDKTLGPHAHSNAREIFEKHPGGLIAARFPDPGKRVDFSGRPILHEVVIPKSMSPGINNLDDVRNKIWPHLKDSYDTMYKASEERR
jgi:hypothetical protein